MGLVQFRLDTGRVVVFQDEEKIMGIVLASRVTTADMIGMFRSQLWGKAMGVNLKDFADKKAAGTKPVLYDEALPSAVCYAFR